MVKGNFIIKNVSILSDHAEDYVVVINVWGVESSYQNKQTFVTVKRNLSTFDEIFQFLEAYLAFVIAAILILSSSFGFPFFLIPISLILLGTFLFYVYKDTSSKGVLFISIIFIPILASIIVILIDLISRCFCKKKSNSPYFY